MTCLLSDAQDAEKAIALGIEGILVSNHGPLPLYLFRLGGLTLGA